MSNIALIPARSGSKRIKNKNILEFEGLPLIAHAIKLALDTNIFDQVIVSTDDEAIREISLKYGASVPWIRPKKLADDFATTSQVMKHSAQEVIKIHPQTKNICCLYPTTPLLDTKLIISAYELFIMSGSNFTFPSFEHQIYRTFTLDDEKKVVLNFPEYSQSRTQDLKRTYIDSGQFYWGKFDAWLQGFEIFGSSSNSLVIPRFSVVDIDSVEDLELAANLFRLKKGRQND